MAIQSLCAKIFNGLDVSCVKPVSKYYQQAVIINKSDIASYTITLPDEETEECAYTVVFELNPGATGYRIIGAEAGSSFYGSVSKTRSDPGGYAQYVHNVGIFMAGLSEESKCILSGLDKGSFVIALQAKDETVEIFGIVNGLTTGDYEYNIQEGGGGTQIILSSLEDAQEGSLPLIYESAVPGQETEDFDDAFAVAS
jgi:hypothetical protein